MIYTQTSLVLAGYAEEVDRLREEMRGNEVAAQALASCLQ